MSKNNCVKVTLSTKKVVLLRELKIAHTEQATRQASPMAEGDNYLLAILMQKALLNILLISIDGKEISAHEREDMDALFSYPEYQEATSVISDMMGAKKKANPKIEMVTDSK
jgi:hypothetical protein